MYGRMVSAVTGSSSGARALSALAPMARAVSRGAGNASASMGMAAGRTSGIRSRAYGAGASAASAIARHPMRAIGGAGVGLGAAGYGASRRRGSQNYPMY
jgi:hypothetical protein